MTRIGTRIPLLLASLLLCCSVVAVSPLVAKAYAIPVQLTAMDDDSQNVVIERIGAGDQVPVFSNSDSTYRISINNIPGTEGVDYRLELALGEDGTYDYETGVFDDPLVEGTDYTFDADTKILTLKGESIYQKLGDYGYVDIRASVISAQDSSVLGEDVTWVVIREAIYDYASVGDCTMLVGNTLTVDRWYDAYVLDADHYDEEANNGWSGLYEVTDVSVIEGNDCISVTEEDGDERWWCLSCDEVGTATVQVTYLDIDDETQSYTFQVEVVTDIYDVYVDALTPDRVLPGGSVQLQATGYHESQEYDPDESFTYKWSIPEEQASVAILAVDPEDSSKVTVTMGELPEGVSARGVDVTVTMCSLEGDELAEYTYYLRVDSDFYETCLVGFNPEMEVGQSIDVTAEVRHYSVDNETEGHYDVVPDVTLIWDYDQETIEVRDSTGEVVTYEDPGQANTGSQVAFTIKRLSNESSSFYLAASYELEEGDSYEGSQSYSLDYRDYYVSLDADNNAVYSDGTLEVEVAYDDTLNMDVLDLAVGLQIWDEDAGDFVTVANDNYFSMEGTTITLNGPELFAKFGARNDLRLYAELQNDGEPVDEQGYGYYHFMLREAIEDYVQEQDRTLLIGEAGWVENTYNVHVENAQYTDGGEDFEYAVTNVTAKVNDGVIKLEEEDGRWHYEALDHGTATLEVTYLDLSGATKSYTFDVNVTSDVYGVDVHSVDGTTTALPGESIQLQASGFHDTDYVVPEGSEETLTYDWAITEVNNLPNNWVTVTPDPEDSSKATVTFSDFPEGEAVGIWGNVQVTVTLLGVDSETQQPVERAQAAIRLDNSVYFQELRPLISDIEADLGIEETQDITAQVLTVTYGVDPTAIDDVQFSWDYNEDDILILDGNGDVVPSGEDVDTAKGSAVNFTIKRLSDAEVDFTLRADWTEHHEGGHGETDMPYHEERNYHLNAIDQADDSVIRTVNVIADELIEDTIIAGRAELPDHSLAPDRTEPVIVSVPDDAPYTLTSSIWVRDARGTLYEYTVYAYANGTYYIKLTFEADEDHIFGPDPEIEVEGGQFVSFVEQSENAVTAIVSVVATPKVTTPIETVSLTVTPPDAGTTAYNATHSGDGVVTLNNPDGYGWIQEYTRGAIYWYYEDGSAMRDDAIFRAGGKYRADIHLRSDDDRKFTNDTQVNVTNAEFVDKTVGAIQSWTTMEIDVLVTVPYAPEDLYDLHIVNDGTVSIHPTNTTPEGYFKYEDYGVGETVNLHIEGSYGYLVDTVTITNDTTQEVLTLSTDSHGVWSFTMPDSDVTITYTTHETGKDAIAIGSALKDGAATSDAGTASWTAEDEWGNEIAGSGFSTMTMTDGWKITMGATPKEGYEFVGWYEATFEQGFVAGYTGECISTDPNYTFVLGTEGATSSLCAVFDVVYTSLDTPVLAWEGRTVTWNAVPGATSYGYEYYARDGSWNSGASRYETVTGEVTGTSLDLTSFIDEMGADRYTVRVWAKRGDLESESASIYKAFYSVTVLPTYKEKPSASYWTRGTEGGTITGTAASGDAFGAPDEDGIISGVFAEGDTITLTAVPVEGYELVGFQNFVGQSGLENDITDNPFTFELTRNQELLWVCFSKIPTYATVTVDLGAGHETFAQSEALAQAFEESEDASFTDVSASGSVVTFKVETTEGIEVGDLQWAIGDAIAQALGQPLDANERFIGVGQHTIDYYDNSRALDDEISDSEDVPADGQQFFALWAQPINSIEATLAAPVCGTQMSFDEEAYEYLNTPQFTITAGDHAVIPNSAWVVAASTMPEPYFDPFVGGETYTAILMLSSEFGYYIPDDVVVTVNGETAITETQEGPFSPIVYYFAAVKAVHDWDDGVVTTQPTPETEGVMTYTCKACGETKTEVIPVLEDVYLSLGATDGGTVNVSIYNPYTATTMPHEGETMSNFGGYWGYVITMEAVPENGYKFVGWYEGIRATEGPSTGFVVDHTDTIYSTDGTYRLTLKEDTNIQAVFELDLPVLNIYAGATRYDVSTMISDTLTADESYDGIVVVSGENGKFADALSASGLAGLLGYPLVVLNGFGLTDADRATLANYAGDDADLDIVVIGGTATVTPAVEAELSNYGTVSQRIAGADRYAVNAAVYEYGAENGDWGDVVFVARGDNFPDALTIAPYMVAKSCPIILVDPKATVFTDTQKAIAEGASRGIVLGGTASVTDALQARLLAICGQVARLGGADRYEASANIVRWELSEGMTLEGAGFATGAKFPDALGSGFILGSNNAVLCLVDSAGTNDAMRAAIAGADPAEMNVFGGTASVPEAIYDQMADAVGWGTAYEKVQK